MSDPLIYPILRADEGRADASVVDWRRRFSCELKIYDTVGTKVAEIVSDMQNTTLVNLQFELLQIGGCGSFSFTLGEEYTKATIDYNYRVEICFYTQEEPWFTGFITKVPKKGTDLTWTYEGFGYFQQLEFVRINKTDTAGQELAKIVEAILDSPVVTNTNITKSNAKIPTTIPYITKGDHIWEYITARAVFERLAEIAQNYEFGVDYDRDFYFRPISTVEMERFWIGKHLDNFKSEEDESDLCNKLYIRCGLLTDGTDYTLFVEDAGAGSSQAAYGLREDVVEAPEIYPLFSRTNLAVTPTTNAGGVPAAMVDGNPSTLWTSTNPQAVGDYIQVDLGIAATYDRIALVTIDSSDPNAQEFYARDFDIRVSTAAAFAGEETVVFSGQLSNYRPQIFFTPLTGRYVRVTLTGAHANQWKVGEFEVYELDTADLERWGNYILSQRKDIKKRASLTINGVQNLFNRRKNLEPIEPRGIIGIYDENGKHIDDYSAKACRYTLTPDNFSLTMELGSLELGIPQQIREMLQRQKELSMSRVRTAGDLAGGVGIQPVVLTPTMIQKGAIEIPHLRAGKLSMYGGLVEAGKGVMTLGGHGFIVSDGTHVRFEAGKLNGDYGATIRDSSGNVTVNLGTREDAFSKIYDNVLTAPVATVTVAAGLAGDTDHMYCIVATMKNAHAGGNTFFMTINNDGGNNYGWQTVYCVGAGAAGFTGQNEPHMHIGTADALNEVSQIFLILHAKSGFARIANGLTARQITGTLVEVADAVGYVWTNVNAEINRLDFFGEQALNFGIDSHFIIYKVPSY